MFRLNDVLKAIRAGRWILVLAVLAGLGAAYLLSATAVRTYVSSTQLFVTMAGTTDAPSAYQGSLFTQERMDSYARLLSTSPTAQLVVDDLGVPLTADQVLGKVTAVPVPDTDILEVTVTDTSPERAQAIADSLGRQFTAQVTALENPTATLGPTIAVQVIEPATFDATPVSPSVPRYLVVGVVLGLLVGLGLAVARQRADRTVRGVDAVRDASGGAPVVRLPEQRSLRRPPVSGAMDTASPADRAFRLAAQAVGHGGRTTAPRVVVVTSPAPDEGKSTVAAGLAVSLARSGRRVLLVDANLWRPRLPRYLGLPDGDLGLTSALSGAADWHDLVQRADAGGPEVLPAGPMPEDPGRLLGSPEMQAFLAAARASYDHVVVDAPALLPVVDAAALAASSDGVLLVTRHGRTTRTDLAEAASALTAVGARLLGVVLNRVPRSAATTTERQPYAPDTGRRGAGPLIPRPGTAEQSPPDEDPDADVVPAAGSGQA
ncbi:polysaccharide biosynthesis tyrosine autokinase [Blastococcus sp. TF02A-30]|uniref:polysaccharide biosynthesis tyrosine autokinase n=1 Tax=Blastococcus sp. TF02A-30 TaxID=2250580 RepID=UPI000DEB9A39|nr:polysaccharide biosynthesis tyrosine autokinase [Blastococcus sp. TF02A-30]RBY84547.1 cell shape-determining protein [Blastococcus sp. TF02A-30]